MRILFMGTPCFAGVSLEHLVQSGHELLGVVTQPDRPKGRGMILQPCEVKQIALKHQLPVWQPEKVATPEFLDLFHRLNPDLVIVVAFGQKIPTEILFGPKFGCINVHGSLLPKYRGAAPIQWSILNGDPETGVTTMYMDEGWDTGDLIYQERTAIGPDENFACLYDRLAEIGGRLLVKTVQDIAAGKAPRIKQDPSLATLAPKLKAEQQQINWSEPAKKIHNLIRTLAPLPGAETYLNNERLKIMETQISTDGFCLYLGPNLQGGKREPGTILQVVKKQGLLVACGDGPLLITKMQPAGKKVMSALECANGRCLQCGMLFCKV
ncbi:MAG TPA: methionyl-tRNA formyltransferase [Firmicutes bacterium]|nr:methionyl-tRNA formyltransferase [Bacillota bacterium]